MNKFYTLLFLSFSFLQVKAVVIFSEDIGTPSSTTLITSYTGWQNIGVLTFTGSGDVRTSVPSTGYTGASGNGNVFLNSNTTNKTFIISGFTTSTYTSIALNFGVYKNTTTSNGSELTVEYSTSGIGGPWSSITIPPLPTGTGTAIWFYRSSSSAIPTGTNAIRFTNTNTSTIQFRLDDISLTGTLTGATPEIQLQQPIGTDSACGFTYDFGTQTIGTNTDFTVRIQNLGTAILNISSTPITGTNALEFSVLTPPSATIAANSYSDMVIRYSPSLSGSKSAKVTINSDDADESACEILLTANATYSPCTELIISEYGEPLTGNGKYIEIYNGTASAINLANYQFWKISNGGTWPGSTIALTGTIASNSTFVLANNATDVPGANLYNATFCNWNGNDAIGLAKQVGASYYLIDAVGTDGADPGTGWSVAGINNATADRTLVRKTSINTPNTNWTTSAGTTISNSEWYVRPYQLGNVGCNINSCLTTSSIGFDVSSASIGEANTTVTVYVTMSTAPTTTVNAIISDALLGTATSGTDYTAFANTTLTFTPAEIYPNTKSVTLNILDDAISESNENIVLSIDAQCGALIANGNYSLTIIDNEVPEGIVINEFSQGSFSKEYIELVATGTPGTTIDLRGWIVDDNSGIFSGGYGTQMGIADGHLKFSDICTWEKVPVGSIILIYNASDKNSKITMADDPTDANLDYLYVIGMETASSTCATMSVANLYFSSDCVKPNNTSYDQYTPPVYTNVDWGTIEFRNGGDAMQVRSPTGGFFHGLSYGTKGSGSDCSTCAISQNNHPDYSVYSTNALYFSGTTIKTFSFQNIIDNDFRKLNNWTSTTSTSPNTLETPGTFNSANNQAWILSLRTPFGVVLDNQSYTCNLRAYESRYYLDGIDSIIYWIKNNTATDHGSFTAQTILHDDATPGKGFQNAFLTGAPLFMQKTFVAIPTVGSPANYTIRFYVSTAELQDYCDYINPILNAIPGYYTMHNHTPAEVISHLKIYRTSTTDRAWTVTSDAQVQIVNPTIANYGAYTTFEYNGFTGFSGYALGDVVTPIIGLPVELINFNAKCNNDVVTLNWATASEKNFNYFEVERSIDAVHFTTLERINSTGASTQIKQYQYQDLYPVSGINYYRLKQQDNGNVPAVYSNLVTTKCDETTTALQTFYDNENNFVVQINSATTKNIQFKIYEISGKLLYQESKNIQQGYNKISLNFHEKIADGIYIIQAIDGNAIESIKILVH